MNNLPPVTQLFIMNYKNHDGNTKVEIISQKITNYLPANSFLTIS